MLNDLAIVSESGIMQGCVAFIVLDVDEGLLNASQELHDFKVSVLAGEMKGCFSRLGTSVDLGELLYKELDQLKALANHSIV